MNFTKTELDQILDEDNVTNIIKRMMLEKEEIVDTNKLNFISNSIKARYR
jgi:hypothetical protein